MTSENVMKTGTTTVGIVCKGGIVLAADKRATAGYLIAQKDTDIAQDSSRIPYRQIDADRCEFCRTTESTTWRGSR